MPTPHVRKIWLVHFSSGLLVLIFSMICNGGRKYISVNPKKAEMNCQKMYVNVYSSSINEPGSMICCIPSGSPLHSNSERKDHHENHVLVSSTNPYWWESFSYEGYLCNQKIKTLPLSKSITQFPDSWILPVIPILLRILIATFGKVVVPKSTKTLDPDWSPNEMLTSFKRLLFHLSIMMFRGWGLYVYMNMLEDIVLTEFNILPSKKPDIMSGNLSKCWYSDFLWEPRGTTGFIDPSSPKLNDECFGQAFDFSDHVVLFFSHSLPSLIFEGLFCVLFPFYHVPNSFHRTRKNSDPRIGLYRTDPFQREMHHHCWLHLVLNLIVPLIFFLGFLYLNLLTLLALHSTVAYFHSTGEVLIGFIISLMVQYPIGMIICSPRWKKVRTLVGYPID